MSNPFRYQDDPLKHHVRLRGWLPLCRRRHRALQERSPKRRRRLRYFTFCAVGAVDVLMLDVARVIKPSRDGRFDTVYFFDRTPELVTATQDRIPGAHGFVGDFVKTVLSDDPVRGGQFLGALTSDRDTLETRKKQRERQARADFEASFPFDIVNLDLQDFIFKTNDEFPGRLVRALRRVFEWQRKPLEIETKLERLDGFTLLFTTRVGPTRLRNDYAEMLANELESNLANDSSLLQDMRERTGVEAVGVLREKAFGAFFEMGVPKVIAKTLMEQDWYIDEKGIKSFKFRRDADGDGYDILHYAMDVCRKEPGFENRAPGMEAPGAEAAYRAVSKQIFSRPAEVVTIDSIDEGRIEKSLGAIDARRKKYLPGAGE